MELPAGHNGEQSIICLRKKNTTVKEKYKSINHHSSIAHTTSNDVNSGHLNESNVKNSKSIQAFSIKPYMNNLSDPEHQSKKRKRSKNKIFGDHLVEKENNLCPSE